MQRRQHGFTLIELLVVISIIALLISILLPTLKSARKAAQDIQCGSNLRGFMQAAAVYAEDYQGKLIHTRLSPIGASSPITWWQEAIWEYGSLGAKPASGDIFDLAPWEGTILFCPSAVRLNPPQNTRTYGCNLVIQPGVWYINPGVPGAKGEQTYIDHVKRPSETHLFADANSSISNRSALAQLSSAQPVANSGLPAYFPNYPRHREGTTINVAYIDGHVVAQQFPDLPLDGYDDVFWHGGLIE